MLAITKSLVKKKLYSEPILITFLIKLPNLKARSNKCISCPVFLFEMNSFEQLKNNNYNSQ